ncbi:hypothetical protein ACHQM5_019971 [Ranunculus cassubicifolius]
MRTQYNPPEGTNVSVKHLLKSLLPRNVSKEDFQKQIMDFSLCCAEGEKGDTLLSWIPKHLSVAADRALGELGAFFCESDEKQPHEQILVIALMPHVLPVLKGIIKESSIDTKDDENEISAASARTPVAYAIVAAHQFRWFVTQVNYPYLGNLSSLVIPCALTPLDHWSPAVKGFGQRKGVDYDEIFSPVVKMTSIRVVLGLAATLNLEVEQLDVKTAFLHGDLEEDVYMEQPEGFEKMMNEMLSNLEHQPGNKERYITWLELVEPIFVAMGLVLLAHFRRIFPLFFHWMHNDDDKTILLVLRRTHTIIKLTWVRNTPYIERCKGLQFEEIWKKHNGDPNLSTLHSYAVKVAHSLSRIFTRLANTPVNL